MKYILLIYGKEEEWLSMSREEMETAYRQHGAYAAAMEEAGVMRGGAELKPVTTATTVRFENGLKKTIDGPFAETKEQLGGYYLIEVEDVDEAISWADKMPCMQNGAVEIRPLGME